MEKTKYDIQDSKKHIQIHNKHFFPLIEKAPNSTSRWY